MRKNWDVLVEKKILFSILLIFISVVHLYSSSISDSIKTISAEFKREYTSLDGVEKSEGKIYYIADKNKKIVLKIHNPLDQYMILSNNKLIIYYPKSQQAFDIESRNPFILPFFQFFFDVMKEDFGLVERSFTLNKFETDKGVLRSYWIPNEKLSIIVGKVILTHKDNKLVLVQTYNAENYLSSEILCSDYVQQKNFFYPLCLKIKYYENDSIYEEIVVFENIKFNHTIPLEISSFEIPQGIKTKVVKW